MAALAAPANTRGRAPIAAMRHGLALRARHRFAARPSKYQRYSFGSASLPDGAGIAASEPLRHGSDH